MLSNIPAAAFSKHTPALIPFMFNMFTHGRLRCVEGKLKTSFAFAAGRFLIHLSCTFVSIERHLLL